VLVWRVRAGAALLVVAAVVVAAWWFFWTTPVRMPGAGGGFGIAIGSTVAGRPYSVGSIPLCLDGVGSAVIDSVTVDDGGLRVTDFAVRPRREWPQMGLGSAEQSLRATGFGSDRTITVSCDGGFAELGVEFRKSGEATARTDVLEVHWSAGIRSGTVEVPLHFVLCGDEDPVAPACESVG
jgi:hypothetical protein